MYVDLQDVGKFHQIKLNGYINKPVKIDLFVITALLLVFSQTMPTSVSSLVYHLLIVFSLLVKFILFFIYLVV